MEKNTEKQGEPALSTVYSTIRMVKTTTRRGTEE